MHSLYQPNESIVVERFEKWNYLDTEELATQKGGQIYNEGQFIKAAQKHFTSHYQTLVPWVNRLRRVVFPNDKSWEKEDRGLYSRMKTILREARNQLLAA